MKVQLSLLNLIFSSFDTYPKAGLQNHATILDLICERTLVLFSNVSLVHC